MTQQIERSLEINTQNGFLDRIHTITQRQLTAEGIDSYADDALNDLVDVIGDTVHAYNHQPTTMGGNHLETEKAALHYFGLDPETVETTLDYIALISDQIQELDAAITSISSVSSEIIVPPASEHTEIVAGDGSYIEKQRIPRLKTLLFILTNEFDVDLHDPTQIRITCGAVKNDMMRGDSYNLVEIPGIERTVLVCDEEGNATYVFNNAKIREQFIEPGDLARLTKDDLNDLICEDEALGVRIKYSTRYVPRLIAELSTSDLDESTGQYLQRPESVPDGYISRKGFSTKLGVDVDVLRRVISSVGDELGEVKTYSFKYGNPVKAYSPEQQTIVEHRLEQEGVLNQLPEGYLTLFRISKLLGVQRETLTKAIEEIGDEFGEIAIGRVADTRSRALPHYTPDQQAMLRNYLKQNGHYTNVPDDYLPVNGIATAFNVSFTTVKTAIIRLGDELGETIEAKSARGPITAHFSPVQQERIKQYLEQGGYFAVQAPEGYISINGMARVFGGVQIKTIQRAIENLDDEVGETIVALDAAGRPKELYSPHQIRTIHEWLVANGRKRKTAKLDRDLEL